LVTLLLLPVCNQKKRDSGSLYYFTWEFPTFGL